MTHYVLFFIHLESRGVDIAGITDHPNEQWNATNGPELRATAPVLRHGPCAESVARRRRKIYSFPAGRTTVSSSPSTATPTPRLSSGSSGPQSRLSLRQESCDQTRCRWPIRVNLNRTSVDRARKFSVVRSSSRSIVPPLSVPFARLRVWQLMNYFGHHAK
jgi:hypothetical protein